MQLESLANELLLDLFEFFNGVHLIRTFTSLNSRFDNLLLTHFRSHSLDFQAVSKSDLDIVCLQHLPSLASRINALRLSDDEETPQLTAFFLSHHLRLNQFTHLKALSLTEICSQSIMNKLIDDLYYLNRLLYLNVNRCDFRSSYIDSIWRLTKLTHFNLDDTRDIDWSLVPTVQSLSLQKLSIQQKVAARVSLRRLLEHSPSLRYLSVDLTYPDSNEPRAFSASPLEILKLQFKGTTDRLTNMLETMSNLSKLTIRITGTYVNGYQWQKIITDYLPNLKIFRLSMKFPSAHGVSSTSEVCPILDSYRTPFWIEKHQWFVRCHWGVGYQSRSLYLYTLPFTFDKFSLDAVSQFQSTCPDDGDYYWYDRVRSLHETYGLSKDVARIHFASIHHLSIKLPIENRFWSIMPKLDQLISLFVYVADDTAAQSQLQNLLERAPRLYLLELDSDSRSPIQPLEFTNKSIRRLSLLQIHRPYRNEHECTELSQSSLGIQCEVLSVNVENRISIVYLVNNMKNLRSLNVRSRDDPLKTTPRSTPLNSTTDELIEWLQQHLTSTCKVWRDKLFPVSIRVWIR